MSAPVTHFLQRAEVIEGAHVSDREAWLKARQPLVTASDVAALFDASPFGDAYGLYKSKTEPANDDAELSIDDPRFWGGVLEQTILTTVARYYRWQYQPGGYLLRSRQHPFLGATLDAEVDRGDGLGWVDLEGKTSKIPQGWNAEEQRLPPHILIQAQAQLLVTGAPVALVFGLLQGGTPCLVEVPPDEEFHGHIVARAHAFNRLVQARTPPQPTHKSTDLIRRLYPEDNGEAIVLGDEAVHWTEELRSVEADLKALTKRRDALRNCLRNAIGKCRFGILPKPVGNTVLWRSQMQTTEPYMVAAKTSRPLITMTRLPWERAERSGRPLQFRVKIGEGQELVARYGRRRRSQR